MRTNTSVSLPDNAASRDAGTLLAAMQGSLTCEEARDGTLLHLTANENLMSRTVQQAMASTLSSRYHIGTPADYAGAAFQVEQDGFTFRSLSDLYDIEAQAAAVFQRRLGGVATDFRPLSGLHSMMCTIISLTEPGDIVLSINPQFGGHFATGNLVRALGRRSLYVDFDPGTLTLSLPHLSALAGEHRIAMAFLDEGGPLYPMPFRQIRQILGNATVIVYDASHALGLLMGQRFASPIADGCDIVQGNTHKTFPGPQKGIIHFADEALATRAMSVIGDALVSSQHTHHSAALYFTALEVDLFGEAYAAQIVANAQALSHALEERGLTVLGDGGRPTETHQVLLVPTADMSSVKASGKLFECGISVNAKRIYGRDLIRIGVQEVTRRGMQQEQMYLIADLLKAALLDDCASTMLRRRAELLNSQFGHVAYSFDTVSR